MNLWLGLIHFTVSIPLGFVSWLLGLLPAADLSPMSTAALGMRNLLGWAYMLDGALPIGEIIFSMTVVLGVVVAVHGGNLIRRIFSLFWPGAGS